MAQLADCVVPEKVSSNLHSPSRDADTHRFAYLDALRGIAILGVILVHAAMLSGQGGTSLWTIGFTGQRGVQLFYMVSAFTLFLSLDSGRTEHLRWSNFFIRRFCRIAPLFYLAILANVISKGHLPTLLADTDINCFDILLGIFCLHGISPKAINDVAIGGWSIAVESTFYLTMPFLFMRIKSLGRAISLFVVSALVLGTLSAHLAAIPENDGQYYAFLWFPVEFPVFALGIIAYLVWKQYIGPAALAANHLQSPRSYRDLSILLILTSAVLYIANLPFTDGHLYFSSFLFVPLILGLALHPWPFLVNKFTRFMGKISYSVYLCHFFVVNFVHYGMLRINSLLPGRPVTAYLIAKPLGLAVVFLAILAISIPPCMFTWRFVEQPGIRFGKRWIARREQAAALFRTRET